MKPLPWMNADGDAVIRFSPISHHEDHYLVYLKITENFDFTSWVDVGKLDAALCNVVKQVSDRSIGSLSSDRLLAHVFIHL